MENCLVTKLKSVVENPELMKLNELRIGVMKGSPIDNNSTKIRIAGLLGASYHITTGTGVICGTTAGGDDLGTDFNIGYDTAFYVTNSSDENSYFSIDSKYNIKSIYTYSWSIFTADTADIKYLTGLERIGGGNQFKMSGKIEDLKLLSSLNNINVPYSTITGNVNDIPIYCPTINAVNFQRNIVATGSVEEFVKNLPVRTNSSTIEFRCSYSHIQFHNENITVDFKLKYTSTGIDIMDVNLTNTYATYTRSTNTWEYFNV